MSKVKIYVTKFALSSGIFEAAVVRYMPDEAVIARVPNSGGSKYGMRQYFNRDDYETTLEKAKGRVAKMAGERLARLDRERERLIRLLAQDPQPRGVVVEQGMSRYANSAAGTIEGA